jgi:hypothetical protein
MKYLKTFSFFYRDSWKEKHGMVDETNKINFAEIRVRTQNFKKQVLAHIPDYGLTRHFFMLYLRKLFYYRTFSFSFLHQEDT